jgi:hypothetical protein
MRNQPWQPANEEQIWKDAARKATEGLAREGAQPPAEHANKLRAKKLEAEAEIVAGTVPGDPGASN